MDLQKYKRSLLNKDEEDEKKKKVGGFMLPTYEELSLIEQQAKEDAAAAASSMVRNNMVSDLGRTSAQAARNEIAERAADLNAQKKAEEQLKIDAQKQKVEEAQREYDAYSMLDKIGIGTSAKMADIAKEQVKKQQAEYDRMTMTEQEFEKAHKADFGETIDRFAESAGYGIAKSFGSAVDTTKAIGAGIAAGFANFDSEKFSKSFNRAYQKSLTDGTSLYDEIDAEYQRERAAADEVDGGLNVFTSYVDQAAHSAGEQAVMFWAASMATAIAGGAKVFGAIASKADDMIAGGGKVAKAVGGLLKEVNAGTIGGATSMFMTSSAQATKEAVKDMRGQNAGAAAFGMPQRYTEEEIENKAAVYGLLNGLSESVLEYALGGLTGAQGASKAVKNPLLTALGNYVKGSIGEGVEEITQSLASYGLKRAIYDESAELDWREVVDSGIVGAITGFGMGLPSAVQNTRAAVDAKTTIHKIAKDANNAKSGIDRAKVIFEAEAVAQSSEELAKKMRESDSEGTEVLADIIAWQGEQARKIADTMEADATETRTEGTGEAKRIWDDNNTEHAEIERTGRESGAADDDIRMAGELSDILGKQIRFYREDAKDGTIRNGEYHEDTDTIYINAASKNVKSQIVAHELTHSIEKAGAYKSLVDLTMEKLEAEQKAKGETLDDLYRKKEMLYAKANVRLASYEEITSEIVAEFVEKRLLTDEKSIKSLVQENRTLGQKIKDWFDFVLAKMGNADAQSREYLRKMRDVYAEALGESKGAENNDAKTKYAVGVTTDGRKVAIVESDILSEIDLENWNYESKRAAQKAASEALKKFKGGILVNGTNVKVNKQSRDEFTRSSATDRMRRKEPEKFQDKMRSADVIDDVVIAATEWREDAGHNHERKDNFVKFKRGTTLIAAKDNQYQATVIVGVKDNGDYVFYDVVDIEPMKFDIKKAEPSTGATTQKAIGAIHDDSADNSISQVEENVNSRNTISELDGEEIAPERISREEGDTRYSISYASDIEDAQNKYIDTHRGGNVSKQELSDAHRVTEAMVDVMMQYADILPEDKIGKVLTKNGSYDRSVENTTICVRTLAYNEFVDRVQEQIGRPLTQMESFLVSQKMYDIATDPQCMYCYVSLDRKSYNEMLLRYMQERDTAIDRYNKSDKSPQTVENLYQEFLAGRKDTKNMRDRYNKWISYADNGTKLLSMADIATEARQTEIRSGGGQLADQLKDARAYAQSASWSKIQKDYVAYRDEILKLGDRVVKDLNEHYGMRWYSFSDYSAAFIVENMQQITDAAIRGLKGLSYTKDTDFAKIFAPSGMNINISVFVKKDKNGNFYIDERQSANLDEALALREEYPNVGIVATVTDDDALHWAGEQDWTDVIIPFHIVRTGTDVAAYYKWLNYTAESGDTVKDGNLWNAYVDSLNPKTEAARKKVSKNVYPSEHHNNKETYLDLCESRGLTPRFARFAGEEWYMKLVNETRRSADETQSMKPIFNEAAAKESFEKFVDKGGYAGGWYREGVDVDAEAKAVAEDVLAGKKANEVSYGRQDMDAEGLMAQRKAGRSHGRKYSVSEVDADTSGVVSEREQKDALAGVSSAVETEVEELDVPAPTDADAPASGYAENIDIPVVGDYKQTESGKSGQQKQGASQMTRERASERMRARQEKREARQKIAHAETAFRRLGYKIAGAVSENYEDAAGIIEDTRLAAQANYDIEKYIEDNNVKPTVDAAAKLIASGEAKPTRSSTGLSGEQLKMAVELAEMYKQYTEISKNTVKAQGKDEAARITETYDKMLGGYDWFTDKGKRAKRLSSQLQLNLSNPEQVIRDVFGDTQQAKELNDYLISPTIQNSAEARRQTNKQVAKLREYGLNESESGLTQLFAEYSTMKESGSKKALLDQSMLRGLLLGEKSAKDIAYRIALKEGEIEKTGKEGENGFTKSITDVIETAQKVVTKRAAERALRDYKESGGTNASWNMLSKEQKQSKIDAAAEAIADESVSRIEEAAKEMRLLLDDMYDAINAISVIHGSQPIPFRRGYMPHSHRQTEAVQQWFNDHMGGINVTPVGDLPTDIAGKTADRKPNKRWMAHAQERTGPRTTWDAVGNIEEYLRIANDTIYHMDDIKKMRVLERYIRGIYSVARGETGETAKKKIKNDVLQRMYGAADDETLVFLGLKKNEKPVINDEDMDLSQMTPFVTWLTNYANDLAAKQIFNRDIEAVAGRKYNNIANTITSWSSRVMMQYNISSNLKQLSQVGTVAGDVGMSITKDAAALTARSMRDLGNGTNELEQKYHISERSTFLAEKQNIEEATFASDHDLTEAQRAKRDKAAEIWDYAWSFTDTTMSRFAVYSYFLEGMKRGMNDTDALAYADSKARNILASRMKGSSPLIFQSKNPILRLFTMFQREPLAAWEDVLKTMPREYAEYKEANGDKAAKEWITKRVTGRILGASMTNAAYIALGLGTPAMFDILGAPLSAILEKVIGDLTEDEEDDQTWGEMLKGFGNNLKNEIADDIPFASLIAAITNTAAGTDFESRLPINAPDIDKLFAMFTAPADIVKLTAAIANADDAETIEALQEDRADAAKQIPFAMLSSILEIIGTAAPAGNQIRKSASGLIAVLRGGEYTSDGRLKYEVGGLDTVRAVTLGKSNTKAAQEWVEGGFGSYSESETDAYHALVSLGVGKSKAAKYVNAVTDAEKQKDETKAQAEARILDGLSGLDDDQRAELYYELVATDSQIEAIDAAISAGADKTSAVKAARSIRELSKRGDKVDALIASDMVLDAKRAVYDRMITDEDGDKIDALVAVGLDFEDFLAAKAKQSSLNADESITASQRATRFMAWIAEQGYTDEQEETVSDTFAFASGFKVQAKAYEDLVAAGVTADNAVTATDALSGTSRAIDKINAIWSTGLTGEQLDTAIKAVVTEGWYERYRTVIDAKVPLDVLTWVLDNADANGNDSIDNEERTLILSQLALSRKELSALWIATGGSEKSNPWGSGSTTSSKTSKVSVKTPTVKTPSVKTPSVSTPKININVPYFGFDLEE